MATLKVANIHFDTAGTTLIRANGANTLTFNTAGAEDVRIDSTGNVLIGHTNSTVGQSVKLDVAGGVNASIILINGSSIVATLDGANVITNAAFTQANTARDQGNTAFTQANNAFLRANSTTYTSNVVIAVADDSNAALRITQTGTGDALRVEDSANPDATPFVVSATGNVGIGITDPSQKLHVIGNIRAGDTYQFIGSGTTGTASTPQYTFGGQEASTGMYLPDNATLAFSTNAAERGRIDASGNILIGRTNSTVGLGVKLDINGAVNASALYVNGAPLSGGATIIDDTVNATRYVTFVDATSGTMTKANVDTILTFNPSTGTLSSTIFNSTSDETLKYDVKPIENALAYLDEFNGVHFKWKKTNEPSLGVIAQEVEKVLPELVDSGIDHKTVNYNGLIAVLIQAVKELKAEIEVLKSK